MMTSRLRPLPMVKDGKKGGNIRLSIKTDASPHQLITPNTRSLAPPPPPSTRPAGSYVLVGNALCLESNQTSAFVLSQKDPKPVLKEAIPSLCRHSDPEYPAASQPIKERACS